jgi:hypothetical protein
VSTDELTLAYLGGRNVRVLARQAGCSLPTLYYRLARAGVPLRMPSQAPPWTLKPGAVRAAVEAYRAGEKVDVILLTSGVTHTSLYRWLARAGVPLRATTKPSPQVADPGVATAGVRIPPNP